MKPRTRWVVAAAVGAAATLFVSVLPVVRFAYRSPALHIMLETVAAGIALLAAYLLFGRFRQRQRVPDLLLVFALGVFASTNLFLSALPGVLAGAPRTGFTAWAPLLARLVGVASFAAAPWLPERRVRAPRRTGLALTAAVCTTVAGIALLVVVLGERLPATTDPGLSPEASGRPRIVGHPVVLAVQLVATGAYAAGAAGFLRRAASGDELMSWFAAGSVLAAFSRVNYFLFPSLYSEWVYTGDVLRLGSYLLLLVGAAREIRAYWRGLADTAVFQERRRIARELHDGLAQELAFILGQSRRLESTQLAAEARQIAAAAERALDESRRAITLLAQVADEALDVALVQTAEELAGRLGTKVRLDLDTGVVVDSATREALLRIVREAITNAGRHGRAQEIRVGLSSGERTRLVVRDDGVGFDPATPRPGRQGFGLISMQERAEGLGGTFAVRSRPGAGTEIEVSLP